MFTTHIPVIADARSLDQIKDRSINLVVTSPPYPMIEMWDAIFTDQAKSLKNLLAKGEGPAAFEAMHKILDMVWDECFRVLKPGGFACINIGDATRTLKGHFALYTNHARILSSTQQMGFTSLPCILWRKQTNAPNKFMGSGMLPAGAYVTLEHEYILILRKGGKRDFSREKDKESRRESALFWEERNTWFSDIWFDIKGSRQKLTDKAARKRSGAFPFELAYRLINMYSLKGDKVLDPFLGTGTTMAAAMAAGRNSVGIERDPSFAPAISQTVQEVVPTAQEVIRQRLIRHLDFVRERQKIKGPVKHKNRHYGFPVVTAQEKELLLNSPREVKQGQDHTYRISYSQVPQKEFCRDWTSLLKDDETGQKTTAMEKKQTAKSQFRQTELF